MCLFQESGAWFISITFLYVDDMLIAAEKKSDVNKVKLLLSKEFEMKDLGATKKILGMVIRWDRTKN